MAIEFQSSPPPTNGEVILAYYAFTYQPFAIVAWSEEYQRWVDPHSGQSRMGKFRLWAHLDHPEEITQ